ncbi:MAG TPA: hypothetical protein DDW23_03075 [Planctomycetes bacterium]|nr:hypothetical protein [Planctomycetota bacterium]
MDGILPCDSATLRQLPGIGDYTAAAIASISFHEPIPAVDGNVCRVAARFLGLKSPLGSSALRGQARDWGETLHAGISAGSAGQLNEGLMELGATVCRPRAPLCGTCPISEKCVALATNQVAEIPKKAKRMDWKEVHLLYGVASCPSGVLLEERKSGWNQGLWEPPSVPYDQEEEPDLAWRESNPQRGELGEMMGSARHTITRHRIQARVHQVEGWNGKGAVDPSTVPLSSLGRKVLSIAGVLGGLLLLSPDSFGQDVVSIPRTVDIPRLDGVLEPVWDGAAEIGPLTEVEPVEGDLADPPTDILLMRNGTHLFIAVTCWEPEPENLVLQNMRRDAFLREDDRIEILLDTFQDGKNAYFFQVAAAGSRGDALIGEAGQDFNKKWDGFWEAQVRTHSDRWVVEIAIPFQSIASGASGVWGANFQRYRGSDRSEYRWASPLRSMEVFTVGGAGVLTGLESPDQGLGLEFSPFLKGKGSRTHGTAGVSSEAAFFSDFGGELNWWATPQLKASLTFNTDFAETEVDDRKVNLSRYSLFFPEKRDFFLEDSNLFRFGDLGGVGYGRGGGGNLVPFYSRRIGLVETEDSTVEVPIEAGARLSGRAGLWDLGFLGVRTGSAAGVSAGTLGVFRPSYRLTENLSAGALLTGGNPGSPHGNSLVGADVRYSTAGWLPGLFDFNLWLARTEDESTDTQGGAGGIQASLRTRDWDFRGGVSGAMGRFQPGLGFVRRPGEVQIQGEVEWQPRPDSGPVRKYIWGLEPQVWLDGDGEFVSGSLETELLEVLWHDGSHFELNVDFHADDPSQDAEILDIAIPAGEYDWRRWGVQYRTPQAHDFSIDGRLSTGSYYSGTMDSGSLSLNWKPSPTFNGSLSYSENRGDLPGGEFLSRLESLDFDWTFSSRLSWQNLIQADNQSNSLGIQSRFHWLIADGREFFLVANSGWEEALDGHVIPTSNDFALKVVWSFRF